MSNTPSTKNFPPVTPGKKFSEIEKDILKYWKENDIFQKSVDQRPKDNEFVFYDGPPFATGTPHYGHILAGAIKDAIPRYKTMQGFRVNRKFGWDCHGVPVEFLIEKEHNIGGKPGIEKMGTGPFNDLCQSAVMRCADEWETTVERMGRFVDFKNDYKTMDADYMESVWSVFRELWDKGLIYEGEKVIAYSPRLGSPLSNFEANQNYKQIKDKTLTVKFELADEKNTYILAWTTTPWTLPSNLATCVNPNLEYSYIKNEQEILVVASSLVKNIFGEDAEVLKTVQGSDLVGKKYKPLFPYYSDHNKAFQILGDDFVSADSGTGIVHMAPNFGEEDARVCTANGIRFLEQPIDENGYFNELAPELEGKYFRADEVIEGSKENNANDEVIKILKDQGKIFKQDQYDHDYPFCWRTDCALMYRGIKTWFVDVQKIKKLMIEKNQEINWSPEHLKNGRFGKMLESAPDWAISRNRYWGAPIPVWRCDNEECGHIEVVSTRSELEEKTGKKAGEVSDIHKQFVDELTWECVKCAEKNIPEELNQYLKNIDEMVSSITKENFRDFKLTVPVGKIPQKAADALSLENNEIFLSSFVYAKIRGWTEKNEGHDEITNLEYFLIPFLLEDPTIILEDKKHNLRFLVCESEKRTLLLVVSFERGRNEIVSYFYSHQGKMKNRTVIYKNEEGRPRGIPSWIHDKVTSLVRRLSQDDEKFSSRQILRYPDFIELLEESQESSKQLSKMRRIPEVLDCWFESGAMPYASRGVHFQRDAKASTGSATAKIKQSDFIAEGLDQTRGWFYTLHVLGCALTGENIYKNVITNGIVLAEDGQKMSKSKQNYPDPNLMFDKHGADAMRFYMLSSPVVRAENFRFTEHGVQEVVKKVLLPLHNVYAFFSTYANIDGWKASNDLDPQTDLDVWILTEYETLRSEFTQSFENYKLDDALRGIPDFIDSLTNWYVRRSRDRFWEGGLTSEKISGYETLHFILRNMAKILAPICPFYAEELWRNLSGVTSPCEGGLRGLDSSENNPPSPPSQRGTNSVHLQSLAQDVKNFVDTKLSEEVKVLRTIISLSAGIRASKKMKLRQPLAKLSFALSGKTQLSEESLKILKEEANVKEVIILQDLKGLAKQIVKANARVIGKRFGKKTQEVIKAGKAGEFELLENGEIKICGEILSAGENEYEFGFETAEGIEGDGNAQAVVLLDMEITENLMLEGISRELIRGIQEGRKNSGFQISDRISVRFATSSEKIIKAYKMFGEVIDGDTLTVSREKIDLLEGEKIVKVEIDGEEVLFLMKVKE